VGPPRVIQITPQMRILVAVEAVDFRKGIDSLARLCQEQLQADPFSGTVFVFRSRRATAIKVLVYDGQGFWLAQKRLSRSRFRWWPASATSAATALEAHQLHVLLAAGNPAAAEARSDVAAAAGPRLRQGRALMFASVMPQNSPLPK
jgi:transposase